MKFIAANPGLIETAHTWAQANPLEFYFGMVVALAVVSFKLKDAF